MPPKNTSEKKGPELIGEVVSRLCAARGWGRHQDRLRLEQAWEEAVGPRHAPHTRLGGLKRKILEVDVKGAVLLQELTQFHKKRILEQLRKTLTGTPIADIRFRAGNW